ncbi:hypothetical protein QYH69_32220 [Paraburkholderia sp. SARCC-3016]|uniref:hypothetical protein n=1 Tax=Paraburkholderia sp. SARCC-3016 TaxID=3058611 RepID=UPI0028083CA5|nr:hypothetical protein [Paraburkholderia sp. SARCC-3016]MDQ7981890.1 hypothetical protein [Paraburkholderia sp. SARCC-3016]
MPPVRICDATVLRVLVEHGPLTAAEIRSKGALEEWTVKAGIRWLRKAKRVYVMAFKETEGQGRERPIYAVGNLPDAVFVRRSGSEYSARYAARHKIEIRMRDRRRRNGWNKPLAGPAP